MMKRLSLGCLKSVCGSGVCASFHMISRRRISSPCETTAPVEQWTRRTCIPFARGNLTVEIPFQVPRNVTSRNEFASETEPHPRRLQANKQTLRGTAASASPRRASSRNFLKGLCTEAVHMRSVPLQHCTTSSPLNYFVAMSDPRGNDSLVTKSRDTTPTTARRRIA